MTLISNLNEVKNKIVMVAQLCEYSRIDYIKITFDGEMYGM